MALSVPASLPPPELHDRILAALLPQLHLPNATLLRPVLQVLAYQALHTATHSSPTKPLQLALKLSATPSSSADLDAVILVDLIWAYPNHQNAISTILTRRFDADATLLEQFANNIVPTLMLSVQSASTNDSASIAVKALGSLIRAHDDILSLVVSDVKSVIHALESLYAKLAGEDGLQVKEEVLLLVERITGGAKVDVHSGAQLMGAKSGRPFIDGTLRTDYEAIFNSGTAQEAISDDVMVKLRKSQDLKAKANAVLSVASLFPYVPTHLLSDALNHPTYSGSAQPLVEAILGGGLTLPAELRELSALVAQHNGHEIPAGGSASTSAPKSSRRRNIWQDEELDMSRLKIKDHSDEAISTVAGTEIPNHLRDSILRLVENQAIEAEEQARALAEAHGSRAALDLDGDQDEDEIRRVRVAGEGDASGDEDGEGDKDKTVDKTRRPPREATYDPNMQIKLELAYLTNPAIFDRGSEIRRSEGRSKLKDATGMDDSQLEGWRVMLDRNPHKEAILGRHQVIPPEYQVYLPKAGRGRGGKGKGREDAGSSSKEGSVRGDGESSSRGGHDGGRGGGRGRGGGGGDRGRGRGQNKGSRGHSNAARTRGHDKKMARMGAGV